uniref:Uncharacterized protein n=1 Tax=Nelumbo nucifera TaxID=4432 RepID=A0A822YQM6_NELNU|nr:TPA_asm: hypothetical protein HUJ06_005063 [Nelumbo nucifera]
MRLLQKKKKSSINKSTYTCMYKSGKLHRSMLRTG